MDTNDSPYRSAQTRETTIASTNDPFLTLPIEELLVEHQKIAERKRPPEWWLTHVRRYNNGCDAANVSDVPFVMAVIYWSIIIPYWLRGAPYIWRLIGKYSWENSPWWSLIYVGAVILQAMIIIFAIFINGEGARGLRSAFIYTMFPPSSLWLTGKEFVAWIISRHKGGFNVTPWQESIALTEVSDDFRKRCIEPEQQKVDKLDESLKTLQKELEEIEKRQKAFEQGAKEAGERANAYLKAQQTKSAQIENDRAANVREQMAHTHRYTRIAHDGVNSLKTSTDQYKELQESRLKLRETDSLSPNDTSDAELRAHMRQILLDIQEAIKAANAPVTRTRVDVTPPTNNTLPVAMDEELEKMAEEELRQAKA